MPNVILPLRSDLLKIFNEPKKVLFRLTRKSLRVVKNLDADKYFLVHAVTPTNIESYIVQKYGGNGRTGFEQLKNYYKNKRIKVSFITARPMAELDHDGELLNDLD